MRRAIFTVPMLLEYLKTSAAVSTPLGWSSRMWYLPTCICPNWQSKRSSGFSLPASKAAENVTVFMMDPGS